MAATARSVPRIAAILAVAVMLVLAGCSSGGDGTPGATTEAPDDTTTEMPDNSDTDDGADDGSDTDDGADDGSDTDDGADDGSDTDDGADDGSDTDDGADDGSDTDDGADDGSDTDDGSDSAGDVTGIAGDHTEALRNAGSFTSSLNITSTTVQNGSETSTNVSLGVMIDDENDRGYISQTIGSRLGDINAESYTAGEETFQRSASPFGTQYRYGSEPYGPETNVTPVNITSAGVGGEQIVFGSENLTWTEEGSDTRDGASVTHYTVNDADAIEQAGGQLAPNATSIDSVSVDAYVDGDGVVREMSWSFAGIDQNGNEFRFESSYRTTAIGSTTVEEPDWLDEAREQTGN